VGTLAQARLISFIRSLPKENIMKGHKYSPWLLLAALIFLCLTASDCNGNGPAPVEEVDCHGDVFVEHDTVARVTPSPRQTYSDGSTYTWAAPPYGVEVTGNDGEAVMRIYSASNIQLAKYSIYAAPNGSNVSVDEWDGLSQITFVAGNFVIEDNSSQDICNLDLFAGGVGVTAVGTKYVITVRPDRVTVAVLEGKVTLTIPGGTITLDGSRPYEALVVIQDGIFGPLLPIDDPGRLLEDVISGQDIMLPGIEEVPQTLTLWADERLLPILQEVAALYESDTGVAVQIEAMPISDIGDKYAAAVQAGQGPDLVTLQHQQFFSLVNAGVVQPMEMPFDLDLWMPGTLQAFTYKNVLYGIPYAYDNLALVSNPEFVSGIPSTWSELRGYAAEIAAGMYGAGLIIPTNGYYFYPVQSAFGGYIFGSYGDGTFNPQDLGMGSDGSLASANWFAGLLDSQPYFEDYENSADENQAVQFFVERRAAMIVVGPWHLPYLRQTGVPFQVNSFPGEYQPSRPFLGVYGYLINPNSWAYGVAQDFLLNYLTSYDALRAYALELNVAPARRDVLEDLPDAELRAFGLAGEDGLPIPNLPEMEAVWGPWTDAILAIVDGQRPGQDAFSYAAELIFKDINQ
jgi:arabinogalactan oligomer/maltooligosaccharide transport system substrate-binding protein